MKLIQQTLRTVFAAVLFLSIAQVQAQYCVPSYIAYGTVDGDFLDGVELGTISNLNSGFQGGPSYTDYSATYLTSLGSGSAQILTLYNNPDYAEDVAAWIDYNQDQVFDATELLGEVSLAMGASGTISFTVIGGVTTAYTTTMRVRLAYNAIPGMDPCNDYDYGETEDYAVEILPAQPIDIAAKMFVSPNSLLTVPCGNEDVTVRLLNTGTNTLDFSLNNLTVNGNVSGALNQAFPASLINSGTLLPGDSLDLVLANINMSTSGTYTFSASATVVGDGNSSNNTTTRNVDVEPTYTIPYLDAFTGLTAPDWLSSNMFLYAANSHGNTSDLLAGNLYSSNPFIYSISPKIATVTANNYLLFDYRLVDYTGNGATTLGATDTIQVQISTDCGNTFTPFYTITSSNHISSASMASIVLPLSAYVGSTVRFAFVGIWGGGDYWMDIDNVEVRDVFATDMELVSVDEPMDGMCGSTSQPVSVTIRNKGANPAANIPISVTITGATPSTLNTVVGGPLAPGQTTTINVGNINTYTGGAVSFMAMVAQTGDGDASNDMVMQSVMITPIPVAPTVASVPAICAGNMATLTASGSGATNGYHWLDATTGAELFVGNPFMTSALSASTSYNVVYSESVSANVGKLDNSGTGGGYAFFTDGLLFTAMNAFTIDSILVYPNGAGNVVVNVTDNLGNIVGTSTAAVNPATANAPVRIPVGITVPAAGDYSIDGNGSTILDMFRNDGGAIYPYIDATNSVSITGTINALAGYYYFFYDWDISTLGCESPSSSVTVTVNPNPTVALGNNVGFCAGASTTLSANTQPAGATYSWSNGDVTATSTVTTGGTYTLTVTDAAGCQGSDDILVTVNPLPVVNLGPDTGVCPNGSVFLTPGAQSAGSVFSWTPAAGNVSAIAVGTPGTYSVMVTDANNCMAMDDITISAYTAPVVSLGTDQFVCAGAGLIVVDACGQPAGSTYSWSNNTSACSTSVATSGNLSLIVTNSDGCAASDTVSINILSPITVTASAVAVSCNGGTNGSLTANATGSAAPYTYSWTNGQTTQTISGLTAGSYAVIATDVTNGCVSSLTPFTVTEPAIISATPTVVQPTCIGGNNGSVSLNISGGTPIYAVSWTPGGALGAMLSGVGPGTYTATITDANGCTSTSASTLAYVGTTPTASFSSSINQATGLATFTNTSGGASTYTWNFGDGSATNNTQNPTHTYTTNGTYTTTLIVSNACGSDTITQELTISVGIDVALLSGVKIYPNPVQNVLNIAMEEVNFERASLVLFDSKGAKMTEKVLGALRGNVLETLDMSKLSPGVYMLQVNDGTNSAFIKIVKQ